MESIDLEEKNMIERCRTHSYHSDKLIYQTVSNLHYFNTFAKKINNFKNPPGM
jgi:hypothetical protein